MPDKVTYWQWASCILIIVLQVADMITTLVGINVGGTEQNPMVEFMLQWGVVPFIAFKLLLAGLLGYLALVSTYVVWIIVVLYTITVVNNFNIISQLS